MIRKIARLLSGLQRDRSGNAMMMVALGMPALIGASGMAVDMSQWYAWKRDLQYAVDQAALGGAYAAANTGTADQYDSRARTEFSANSGITKDYSSITELSLANYNGGTANSVLVRAKLTRRLPFSSFITGKATTVGASAQATFKAGAKFTSCIIAVDEDADGAITIGGSVKLAARCGIAALSHSDEAVVISGNPDVDPGWVVAAGGIDSWLDENTDAEIHEYVNDLVDPFADLVAPNDPTPRTYDKQNCKSTTTRQATGTQDITYQTSVYQGNNKNNMTLVSGPQTTHPDPNPVTVNRPAANNETDNTSTTSTTNDSWSDAGSKSSPRYTLTRVVTTTVNNIHIITTTSTNNGTLQPGTYSDITFACNAVMAPGIYVIDGGSFTTSAQYSVQGNGVMIVLKNGANVNINGGANINLTSMTAEQLVNANSDPQITQADANKLEGMLVFEKRDSTSDHTNKLNGSANTVLNGTIYLPNSGIEFTGSVGVTTQCLMIAANTITLLGNATITSMCPPTDTPDDYVTTGTPTVRLVS